VPNAPHESSRPDRPGRPSEPVIETDVLGEPWTAETIALADDEEGAVVATLVHHPAPGPTTRAVLYVHGFTDYFFQVELARWWLDRGYAFYALDLRKYGRSIRPHQTPTYVGDLGDYDEDLDAAWDRITGRDGHDRVVVMAHSTGGLVAPLWADRRRPEQLAGLVLNSPWLDLQGAAWLRSLPAGVALDVIGRRQPMRVLGRDVSGIYGRSLHVDHGGEWTYDLRWKPVESFPVRFGWLRAIRRGHARLHCGLDVPVPVLVLTSRSSRAVTEVGEDADGHDIVLSVRQIRRWATAIGRHVTYVAVPGARHDVILSRPEPRARAYDELERWVTAYAD